MGNLYELQETMYNTAYAFQVYALTLRDIAPLRSQSRISGERYQRENLKSLHRKKAMAI
jgi:hypothetical protein